MKRPLRKATSLTLGCESLTTRRPSLPAPHVECINPRARVCWDICDRSSERYSEYMKAGTRINPFTAKTEQKKNQSWRKETWGVKKATTQTHPYNHTSAYVWFCSSAAIKTSWVCLERSEWTRVWLSLIGCTSEKEVEIRQMFCSWVDLVVKIQTASVTAEHF